MALPARARAAWHDWTTTDTLVRAQDIEVWDAGVYELRSRAVSVKDAAYGALGGGQNDTTQFQAAFDSGAKVVVIPPDSYQLTSVTVPTGVTVLSYGTVTQKASTSGTLLSLTGAGAHLEGPGIWDGNKANQSVSNDIIRIAADDCVVRGITVQNGKRIGVYSLNANNAWVDGCTALNTDYISIFAEATSADLTDFRATYNSVDRTGIAAGSISEGGLKVHGTSSHSYKRVRVEGTRVLMPVSPTDAAAICIETTYSPGAKISGTHSEGGNYAISVAACDGANVSNNPSLYNAKTYGIEVAGSRYAQIQGNGIDGNGLTSAGIILDAGGGNNSDYTSVTGGTIRGCTGTSIKTQSAVGFSLSGVTCYQAAEYIVSIGGGSGALTGLVIDGQGTAKKCVILDNTSNVSISGGSMRNTTEHGVLVFGSSAITIDNIEVVGVTFNTVGTRFGSQLSGGAVLGTNIKLRACSNQHDVLDLKNNVLDIVRAGTPEGNEVAGVGSTCKRIDGSSFTCSYVKEFGTGSTGWVAK
jgi:hypothetical protein